MKDRWNRSLPVDDQQWAPYIGDPFFATGVLKGVFGLQRAARAAQGPAWASSCPTSPASISPSLPRRSPARTASDRWAAITPAGPSADAVPIDDVVDIGFRALAGVLVPGFTNAPPLGDGVNSNDVPLLDHFPFHAAPHAGYLAQPDQRHQRPRHRDRQLTTVGQASRPVPLPIL